MTHATETPYIKDVPASEANALVHEIDSLRDLLDAAIKARIAAESALQSAWGEAREAAAKVCDALESKPDLDLDSDDGRLYDVYALGLSQAAQRIRALPDSAPTEPINAALRTPSPSYEDGVRRDAERLDLLEKYVIAGDVQLEEREPRIGSEFRICLESHEPSATGKTLRAAIDALLSSAQGKSDGEG